MTSVKWKKSMHMVFLGLAISLASAHSHGAIPSGSNKAADFLNAIEGEYRFEQHGVGAPCRGMFDRFNSETRFRISVQRKAKSDEAGPKGRVDLEFRQFIQSASASDANDGNWVSVFDRADFIGINEGVDRTYSLIPMGVVVSHDSKTVSTPVQELEHKVTMTAVFPDLKNDVSIGDQQSGIQTIQWDPKVGRISYRYVIEDRKSNGVVTSHEPVGICSFLRVN